MAKRRNFWAAFKAKVALAANKGDHTGEPMYRLAGMIAVHRRVTTPTGGTWLSDWPESNLTRACHCPKNGVHPIGPGKCITCLSRFPSVVPSNPLLQCMGAICSNLNKKTKTSGSGRERLGMRPHAIQFGRRSVTRKMGSGETRCPACQREIRGTCG